MVRPERARLSERVEADETYVGGPEPVAQSLPQVVLTAR
jgi:hypothetical protein